MSSLLLQRRRIRMAAIAAIVSVAAVTGCGASTGAVKSSTTDKSATSTTKTAPTTTEQSATTEESTTTDAPATTEAPATTMGSSSGGAWPQAAKDQFLKSCEGGDSAKAPLCECSLRALQTQINVAQLMEAGSSGSLPSEIEDKIVKAAQECAVDPSSH